MASVKRSEILEETIYTTNCPHCENLTDIEDPDYNEFQFCEHCKKDFDIVEDD